MTAGRIDVLPKPYPEEFRQDVIGIARQGDYLIVRSKPTRPHSPISKLRK